MIFQRRCKLDQTMCTAHVFARSLTMPYLPPANNSEAAQLGPNALSAYKVCLAFQQKFTEEILIIHARILGYLILHAPNLNVRHEIVKEIHSCNNDFELLSKLGQSFIDYYICPCKYSIVIKKDLNVTRTQSRSLKGGHQPLQTIRAVPRLAKTRKIFRERFERHRRVTWTRRSR